MNIKLVYGLFCCSSKGVLSTPSGKQSIKLPIKIAVSIHNFLNTHIAYTGMKDQHYLWKIFNKKAT